MRGCNMADEREIKLPPAAVRTSLGLLTEEELADALDVSVETLAKWRAAGSGPAFTRPSKKVFYRLADVQVWVTSRVNMPAWAAA